MEVHHVEGGSELLIAEKRFQKIEICGDAAQDDVGGRIGGAHGGASGADQRGELLRGAEPVGDNGSEILSGSEPLKKNTRTFHQTGEPAIGALRLRPAFRCEYACGVQPARSGQRALPTD